VVASSNKRDGSNTGANDELGRYASGFFSPGGGAEFSLHAAAADSQSSGVGAKGESEREKGLLPNMKDCLFPKMSTS